MLRCCFTARDSSTWVDELLDDESELLLVERFICLHFKLGLLAFWGLWFSMIFSTNLFGGFRLMEIFPITWKFASQNFQPVDCVAVFDGHQIWMGTHDSLSGEEPLAGWQ